MNKDMAHPSPSSAGDAEPVESVTRESIPSGHSSSGDVPGRADSPRLLDTILHHPGQGSREPDDSRLRRFLRAGTVRQALAEWFGQVPDNLSKQRLVRRLNADVARLDRVLNDALNSILHAPAFQRLEASWRGLQYLVNRADYEDDANIKIRVLDVTWSELEKDFDRATEFDQSQLFRKVYENEFGMPGGEPYGVLIADYQVHPEPNAQHPHDDMAIVQALSQVAAAAFCPVILNASPAMFGLDSFAGLEHRVDHARTFGQLNYLKWRGLRDREDSRFVGLTLPHTLMRLPYEDDGRRVDRFQFQEDVAGPDFRKYLWGGAAFAVGEVLMRSFAQAGWLADIRGVRRGEERGGLVTGLPVHWFTTDRTGVATKCSTDVVVSDELEKQLSDLGFIPLCHCPDTEFSAFYSNQSIQKPKIYDREVATVNARISSMIQYMLCVSRFAHYVKVLARERSGSFTEAQEFEDLLHRWIIKYVGGDREATPDVKARRPLREAQVKVQSVPGKPGSFQCVMHLAPHYELDELSASVKLTTELTPGTTA
jgi:type VI secretion system ImpC/EvpB family protein